MYWILFVFLIFGLICKVSDADPRQTWFQAQSKCSDIRQRLIINTVEQHTYWTGRYQRISEWLKIIGCFNDSIIEDQAVREAIFENPSAGLCQEFCTQSGNDIFAIKMKRCICLNENFQGELNHPNNCNYSCNDLELVTECGGDKSFNVYSVEKKDFKSPSIRCLALQCGGDPEYLARSCSTHFQPICQKTVHVVPNADTWVNSLEKCKQSSSYLLGNLLLANVKQACTNRTNTGPLWIGISQQIYTGTDRGQEVKPKDQESFQRCQRCRNNTCEFVSCNNASEIDEVYCSEISLSTITHPTKTVTFPATTSSAESTPQRDIIQKNTGTSSNITQPTMQEKHESLQNHTPVLSIVIPIVLVLIISSALTVGGVIYIRRCRQDDKKSSKLECQKKHVPTENTDHCYNEIKKTPESGFFFLEPKQPLSITDIEKSLEKESPYNETEDGEYDHLGNSNSRRKADDTYCHSSSAKGQGYSDYDVTNSKKQDDLEDTYDHTDNYTESDYGHSENSEGQNNYGYAQFIK